MSGRDPGVEADGPQVIRFAAALLPVDLEERGLVLRLLRQRVGLRQSEVAGSLGWPVYRLRSSEHGRRPCLTVEERLALLRLYAAGPLEVALARGLASSQALPERLSAVFEALGWEADSLPGPVQPSRATAALRSALIERLDGVAEEHLVAAWTLLDLLESECTPDGRDRLADVVDRAFTALLSEEGEPCGA